MCAQIHFLKRNEIDTEKWNTCIENATNGLIYSYSFYLDGLCDNWDALVADDYKSVFPLPWRKKAGIKYLYAPPFIQQLGLTGNYNMGIFENIFSLVRKHYKYGDILFNHSNDNLPLPVSVKSNFILPLNKLYTELAARFSNDLKKNLKATEKENFSVLKDEPHRTSIELFQKHYSGRTPHVKSEDYEKFATLCDYLKQKGSLITRSIIDNKKELLAIALLLRDRRQIYNIMNTTTFVGRRKSANHYLIAEILKELSSSDLILDFEGSDLPGVKEFYENFNPINQPFYHYHFNHLPFPLNLFKK
jgi:hypothetical protein